MLDRPYKNVENRDRDSTSVPISSVDGFEILAYSVRAFHRSDLSASRFLASLLFLFSARGLTGKFPNKVSPLAIGGVDTEEV